MNSCRRVQLHMLRFRCAQMNLINKFSFLHFLEVISFCPWVPISVNDRKKKFLPIRGSDFFSKYSANSEFKLLVRAVPSFSRWPCFSASFPIQLLGVVTGWPASIGLSLCSAVGWLAWPVPRVPCCRAVLDPRHYPLLISGSFWFSRHLSLPTGTHGEFQIP